MPIEAVEEGKGTVSLHHSALTPAVDLGERAVSWIMGLFYPIVIPEAESRQTHTAGIKLG